MYRIYEESIKLKKQKDIYEGCTQNKRQNKHYAKPIFEYETYPEALKKLATIATDIRTHRSLFGTRYEVTERYIIDDDFPNCIDTFSSLPENLEAIQTIKLASADKAVYVFELDNTTQENIKKAVIDRLRAEGLSEEAEIKEYTKDAMASKVDSLEDTINIKQIILDSDGQANNFLKRRYEDEVSKKRSMQSKKIAEELER